MVDVEVSGEEVVLAVEGYMEVELIIVLEVLGVEVAVVEWS